MLIFLNINNCFDDSLLILFKTTSVVVIYNFIKTIANILNLTLNKIFI
jgi:hypothetical protein